MLSVVFTYYPRNINKKIFTYYPLRNCDVFVFLIAALAHFFLCDKHFDPLLFLFGEKSGKKVRDATTALKLFRRVYFSGFLKRGK